MSYTTTRKEWAKLEEEILDEDTGMTRADWIEYQYDGEIEFVDSKLETDTASS